MLQNNKVSQVDLFGNVIDPDILLRDKFIEPPFSVLDTKGGSWQRRKRVWIELGIKSEVGRSKSMTYTIPTGSWSKENMEEEFYGDKAQELNTSIFDPALCEVLYHWFCPEKGKILDPFAGGSVRGIVANHLGYKYTGIELRQEQVDNNRKQALDILKANNQPQWYVGDSNIILDNFIKNPNLNNRIKISVKSLKQKFQICEPQYIQEVCKGRCCEGSKGLMVTIHKSEEEKFKDKGIVIENRFIKDIGGTGICPFKKNNLCSIHSEKPFGCKASPFTLNINNTLIIRNRYRLLRCYNTPDAVPAYIAHKWSLEQIFGKMRTQKIIDRIESDEEDFFVDMPMDEYKILKDNDISKHPKRSRLEKEFDFILSCPPYANLEVYSDLPDDISNMSYDKFLEIYESIIYKSCKLLKKGGFACFVVGEVRDKEGNYIGFVPDTIKAFQKAGMSYYNEAILLNAIASASMRANKQFSSGKKLVKIHQNVLVFKKS